MNLVVCAVLSVSGAGPLDGGRATPQAVVVIDRSLRTTTGELVSLRDRVAVVKTGGKDVTIENAVAFVNAQAWGAERDWPGLPGEPAADAPTNWVTVLLADGSLLRGDLLAGKADGLVLVHRRLGKVEFPLDALTLLATRDEASPEPGPRRAGDTVRLANGDRLEGFVESIGPAAGGDAGALAVTIERAGEKSKTTVPLERVSWVAMSGAGSPGKPGTIVWLGGGECTAAAEFAVDKREARIVRAKGSLAARLDTGLLTGAMLDAAAAVPLASCTVKGSVETGAAQPLGTSDVTLPEPGVVSWTLPPGAARISGWAVLPEECRRWGDCGVTVSIAGVEQPLKSFTLNSAAPVVALDLELPQAKGAATLVVTVTEGKHGPVQDRVVLRHVLVGLK